MDEIPQSLFTSSVPDPRKAPALRWGVMGPGWIATRFVRALRAHTSQRVVAIASRDIERAKTAAESMGIDRSHGSYDALAADPEVDIVYVATPHPAHVACGRLALEGGKHVLVEKPIGINAGEARVLEALATERGLFCMEAMWTFFLPKFDVVQRIVSEGWLGDLSAVMADYGEHFAPEHRIMHPELAGGPMLDLGTYPISLVHRFLGPAEHVAAIGKDAPTGVNGQFAAVMRHANEAESVVFSTIMAETPSTANLVGTQATLTIHGPFLMPGDVTVTLHTHKQPQTFTEPQVGQDALHFQAAAVARDIAAGRTQNAIRPMADTIATLEMMDEIRRQLAITYQSEAEGPR